MNIDLLKYNEEHAIYPFGFINSGNTCYFNALLQSLLSCPSLIETAIDNMDMFQTNKLGNCLLKIIFLTKNLDKSQRIINTLMNKNRINEDDSDQLNKKISALYSQLNSMGVNLWRTMIMEIHAKSPDMAKFAVGQQCSREGFHFLMDNMDEIAPLKLLFNHRDRIQLYCQDCDKWISKKDEDNNIFEIEPSLMLEQLEKFQSIDSLYGKQQTLNQFILRQNNYVDKDYICPKCKIRSEKFRVQTLIMIPEILFVVAKKYNNNLEKIKIHTDFPEQLEFTDSNNTLTYDAVAQIEHIGNLNDGHFWSICKRKNGWYKIDDMKIEPSEFKPTEDTYIVIYHFARKF